MKMSDLYFNYYVIVTASGLEVAEGTCIEVVLSTSSDS